jgi:hypothetical protein
LSAGQHAHGQAPVAGKITGQAVAEFEYVKFTPDPVVTDAEGVQSAEAAHEKRTKTPDNFLVTVES